MFLTTTELINTEHLVKASYTQQHNQESVL